MNCRIVHNYSVISIPVYVHKTAFFSLSYLVYGREMISVMVHINHS